MSTHFLKLMKAGEDLYRLRMYRASLQVRMHPSDFSEMAHEPEISEHSRGVIVTGVSGGLFDQIDLQYVGGAMRVSRDNPANSLAGFVEITSVVHRLSWTLNLATTQLTSHTERDRELGARMPSAVERVVLGFKNDLLANKQRIVRAQLKSIPEYKPDMPSAEYAKRQRLLREPPRSVEPDFVTDQGPANLRDCDEMELYSVGQHYGLERWPEEDDRSFRRRIHQVAERHSEGLPMAPSVPYFHRAAGIEAFPSVSIASTRVVPSALDRVGVDLASPGGDMSAVARISGAKLEMLIVDDPLRTQLLSAEFHPAEPLPEKCPGCHREIDEDTCGCGDSRDGHGSPNDVGHSFVPAGCDCFRTKTTEEVVERSIARHRRDP